VLILLPIAGWALFFVVILGERASAEPRLIAAGGSFLRAAVVWGAIVTLTSEVLSYFGAIDRVWVALSWTAAVVIAVLLGWKRGSLSRGLGRIRAPWFALGVQERGLLLGMMVLALGLLGVAWIAPPNNIDSLQYHMSRVMHWAQDRSLAHYATAYGPQLYNPIWAETAILQLRVLWGDDRPANLVQWFSMVGCVVGSLTLASQLRASKSGVFLTAAFVISIPMGVLQATSTQTDYVAAFWILCMASFVVGDRSEAGLLDRVCLGLALGLAALTKATFYVYAPGFVLWYFILRWRRQGPLKMIVEGMAIASLAIALNLGFWARNVTTFGSPYGLLQERLWVGRFLSIQSGTSVESTAEGADQRLAAQPVAQYLAKLLRSTAFHLATPIGRVHEATLSALRRISPVFDSRFVEQWNLMAWNHEDTAPNPFHLVILVAAGGLVLVGRGPRPAGSSRIYVLAVFGSFLLLPLFIDEDAIYVIRYHLPFFVLAGPMVGLVASEPRALGGSSFLSWLMLLLAAPLLLFNNTRPLIGRTPWPTRIGSVWTTPATQVLFASNERLRPSYVRGTDLVSQSGCNRVGLRIDSHDLEYAFWWLLRAPQSGIRIESVYVTQRSKPLMDPEFRPCAILCTICADRERLHGLPLAADLDRLDVFLGPSYVADPDG
jgi:hypothetical protein